MGITSESLSRLYPRLYHMAEGGTWPSIERHGLLSTAALLDLFGVAGEARTAMETRHRPESVTINHPSYGDVVIRDQKPILPAKLERCLDGCTAAEWYAFVNARVYFWVTEERVRGLRAARAYRDSERTLLVIDTAALLERYGPPGAPIAHQLRQHHLQASQAGPGHFPAVGGVPVLGAEA